MERPLLVLVSLICAVFPAFAEDLASATTRLTSAINSKICPSNEVSEAQYSEVCEPVWSDGAVCAVGDHRPQCRVGWDRECMKQVDQYNKVAKQYNSIARQCNRAKPESRSTNKTPSPTSPSKSDDLSARLDAAKKKNTEKERELDGFKQRLEGEKAQDRQQEEEARRPVKVCYARQAHSLCYSECERLTQATNCRSQCDAIQRQTGDRRDDNLWCMYVPAGVVSSVMCPQGLCFY